MVPKSMSRWTHRINVMLTVTIFISGMAYLVTGAFVVGAEAIILTAMLPTVFASNRHLAEANDALAELNDRLVREYVALAGLLQATANQIVSVEVRS